MFSAIFACLLLTADPPPPDAIVVAPREFLPALLPLIEHRQQQGHRIIHAPSTGNPAEIRAAIRKAASAGGLKYVLIVGDAEPVTRANAAIASRCVPTHLEPAVVNVQWGSEPHIASDNWISTTTRFPTWRWAESRRIRPRKYRGLSRRSWRTSGTPTLVRGGSA
jgi:peptidase C25-like protein